MALVLREGRVLAAGPSEDVLTDDVLTEAFAHAALGRGARRPVDGPDATRPVTVAGPDTRMSRVRCTMTP